MSTGSDSGGGGATAAAGQGSPRSKVKFLCSYGGKILPRPSDGVLKYVGGETRVVSVARDISFSELMNKLAAVTESRIVLKYQLMAEDLDTLVSVKSDEDLKHMMDEHDRHESAGIPKLRTFLFPAYPAILENQVAPVEPQTVEQRYIEAINGDLRIPIKTRPLFSTSASSSPKSESPEGHGHEAGQQPESGNYHFSKLYPMHKVQSSPNICGHQNSINQHLHPQHHHQPGGYYQMSQQGYFTCRLRPLLPLDFHKGVGNERILHGWVTPPSHCTSQPHPTPHTLGGGGVRCIGHDDDGRWGRAHSVPHSPRRHGLRL